MTQSYDPAAVREFVDNDEGYKLVRNRHNKIHQAARSARNDILLELRKIDMLLSAFDLCVEKAWEHHDITEGSELDKQLKRLTPDDSELWYTHYNAAADLIKQQLVDQCKTVITADNAAEKLEIEASSHCDALSAARAEAVKRYQASLEPVKRGPGRPKKTS